MRRTARAGFGRLEAEYPGAGVTPPLYHAWARSGPHAWRPCVARDHPHVAHELHEARYLAARWLAVDGVTEALVLPVGIDPNVYDPARRRGEARHIPRVAWRAAVTWDTSPTTLRNLIPLTFQPLTTET